MRPPTAYVMTWEEMAIEIAAEFGLRIGNQEAHGLLWEQTGFPAFWNTEDPVMECSNQLRRALRAGGHRRVRPLRCFSYRLANTRSDASSRDLESVDLNPSAEHPTPSPPPIEENPQ